VKSFKEIDSPQNKTDSIDTIGIAERLRFRQPKHLFNANMQEATAENQRRRQFEAERSEHAFG